jgi:cell division protein FtsW (lipid II flippase)
MSRRYDLFSSKKEQDSINIQNRKERLIEILLIITGFLFAGFGNIINGNQSITPGHSLLLGTSIFLFITLAIIIYVSPLLSKERESGLYTIFSISFTIMLFLFFFAYGILNQDYMIGYNFFLISFFAVLILLGLDNKFRDSAENSTKKQFVLEIILPFSLLAAGTLCTILLYKHLITAVLFIAVLATYKVRKENKQNYASIMASIILYTVAFVLLFIQT